MPNRISRLLLLVRALLAGACLNSCGATAPPALARILPESAVLQEEREVPSQSEWLNRLLSSQDDEIDMVEALTVVANAKLGLHQAYSSIPSFLAPFLRRARARLADGVDVETAITVLNEEVLPGIQKGIAVKGSLRWVHEALGHFDGDCAVTTALYIIAGDAIGLHLSAAHVPKHLFVCFARGSYRRNVETTEQGQHRSFEEFRESISSSSSHIFGQLDYLPEERQALDRFLAPMTRRELAAMLLCHTAPGVAPSTDNYEAAARLAPGHYHPLLLLSSYHLSRGHPEEAAEFLTKALALADYVPALYASRAVILNALGRWGQALQDVDAALRLAPHCSAFHYVRSRTLAQRDDWPGALGEASRAVEGVQDLAEYWAWRASCLEKAGRYRDGIADLDRAVGLRPTVADLYRRRGKLWSLVGDEERSAADLRTARDLEH